MSSTIKCPKCSTWNENKDYCTQCNELLNYEIKRQLEVERKEQEVANRPKDKFDLYLERIKNSDKFLDKVIYFILQSIWFTLILIASAGVAFAAFGPG